MKSSLKLIAAIGKRGQLGLNGELPWGHAFPEDRRAFRHFTAGGVLIAGYRTFKTIAHLHKTADRIVIQDNQEKTPERFLGYVDRYFSDGKPIWIVGGAATYRRYLPLIPFTERYIAVLDYDGPADVWMPEFVLPDDKDPD